MAVEEKQLYLRGGSRPTIEPCPYMLEYYYLVHMVIKTNNGSKKNGNNLKYNITARNESLKK